MADPKYADLPGIDTQPDVFETNDLPEDDQQASNAELNSESVEKLPINTDTAYGKFKDKKLHSGAIDFSDRITHSRRTGYAVPRTEYEILEEGSLVKETPVQKFQRLQHEMRELSEEVEELKKSAQEDSKGSGMSPVDLAHQVTQLQEQLYGLHLEKILGTDAIQEAADPQGTLPKKLLSQLDAYKNLSEKSGEKSEGGGKPTQDGHVTYELFYKPELAKFNQLSKVADLEQRIARLEAVLGQDPQKLSSLTADTKSKSLLEAVEQLQAQSSLLDPLQLDHVDARMQHMLQRLNQIKEKEKAVEESNKESKVAELYDMVEKWDGVAETLPQVVERLHALSSLHEQALQFSQALTHLDTSQQQISTNLHNQDTLLKELKASFAGNMSAIQANCQSLEERMKKFKK
ncbi:dynactin subunit 2-B-like isoform X2 [Amphiura filiformis]|uniref:dynactin subunit 2-B-like isoform X2 n=1 Tax=Amphiura filiformis TaxID=82378 RepID=UPI003B22685F